MGLTIGHAIIKDFLVSRMKDTPQGQQISVNDQDTFTMLAVLAKNQCHGPNVFEEGQIP